MPGGGVRHFILHRAVTLLAPYYAHTSTYSAPPNQPPRIASRVPPSHPVPSPPAISLSESAHASPGSRLASVCLNLLLLFAHLAISPASTDGRGRHISTASAADSHNFAHHAHALPRPSPLHCRLYLAFASPQDIAVCFSAFFCPRSPGWLCPSADRAQPSAATVPSVPDVGRTRNAESRERDRLSFSDPRRAERKAGQSRDARHARTAHGTRTVLGQELGRLRAVAALRITEQGTWNARPRSELCGLGLGCHRLGLGQGAGHDDDRWSSQDAGHLRVERHAVRAGWRHRTRMNGRPGKARTTASREEAQTRCAPSVPSSCLSRDFPIFSGNRPRVKARDRPAPQISASRHSSRGWARPTRWWMSPGCKTRLVRNCADAKREARSTNAAHTDIMHHHHGLSTCSRTKPRAAVFDDVLACHPAYPRIPGRAPRLRHFSLPALARAPPRGWQSRCQSVAARRTNRASVRRRDDMTNGRWMITPLGDTRPPDSWWCALGLDACVVCWCVPCGRPLSH